MTASAERAGAESEQQIGGETWRARALLAQERALPPAGSAVVTCSAPAGSGGLGRHAQELVEAFARRGEPALSICGSPRRTSAAGRLRARALGAALSLPPLRLAAAQRALRYCREFDSYAAARLPASDRLLAFNGTALAQLKLARERGGTSASLVSATSHFRLLLARHERALRQYPLEESWARRLLARNLAEYRLAERIYVASDYAHESFIAEGFAEESLRRFPLIPDPRYAPAPSGRSSSTFDVVYVGSLSVVKGVPLLIDAVRALPHQQLRLILVGGWSSRGLRRFVQRACAEDARILAAHGDPLPALRGASLYVHPSFNDGFGYAPAEALACGVPAIVSADTGMKDLIEAGRNGLVVPTGDLRALSEAIDAAYRSELLTVPS